MELTKEIKDDLIWVLELVMLGFGIGFIIPFLRNIDTSQGVIIPLGIGAIVGIVFCLLIEGKPKEAKK